MVLVWPMASNEASSTWEAAGEVGRLLNAYGV